VQNSIDISRSFKGPIFLVGDLRQAGDDYALLSRVRIKKGITIAGLSGTQARAMGSSFKTAAEANK
jgi:hypothetical protein